MKLKFLLPHNSPKMAKAKEFAGHVANTSIEELGRHQILCGLSFVGAIAPWHRPSRKCRSVKKTALLLLIIEPLGAHSSAHINCPIHKRHHTIAHFPDVPQSQENISIGTPHTTIYFGPLALQITNRCSVTNRTQCAYRSKLNK